MHHSAAQSTHTTQSNRAEKNSNPSITITSTDPDGRVLVGSNNTIYEHIPTEQQTAETIEE